VASPDASRRPKIEHYTLKPCLFEAGTSGMDAARGLVQGGIFIYFISHIFTGGNFGWCQKTALGYYSGYNFIRAGPPGGYPGGNSRGGIAGGVAGGE
jgi:hypothetical protein